MGKQQHECTIITMILIINSVLVITIELTSYSFDTHMSSSKHNPTRMTLVKYSYGTAEKHEMEAAPLCEQYHAWVRIKCGYGRTDELRTDGRADIINSRLENTFHKNLLYPSVRPSVRPQIRPQLIRPSVRPSVRNSSVRPSATHPSVRIRILS